MFLKADTSQGGYLFTKISPSLGTAPIPQKYVFYSHVCSDSLAIADWSRNKIFEP